MVKRIIQMNDTMKRMYFDGASKTELKYNEINCIIESKLLKLKKSVFKDHMWISEQSSNLSYQEIIEKFGTLSAYEWETEFYFCKEIVNNNWHDTINLILQKFELYLLKHHLGNKFLITVIGQHDEFENLNVRLQLYRQDELYYDFFKKCCQPILFEIFEFNE